MKLAVDAVMPFASVTVMYTADEPVTVGVPEIMPVEVLKLRPFTNDPVREYVNAARPPAAGTGREKELSAVPVNPVGGVVSVSALATVTVATVDAVVMEMPDKVLVTSTE